MPVYGVIDIGSNSVKLHVAENDGDAPRVLADHSRVTRLASDLHADGRLGEAAMARSLDVLAEYRALGDALGVSDWAVVATMAMRNAANADVFAMGLAERCGLRLEIITGEEEARLASQAAFSGLGQLSGRVCIFDSGGGSTEFVFSEEGELLLRFSLNVGSRRPTELFSRHDPITEKDFNDLRVFLRTELSVLAEQKDWPDTLVAVGGTASTLGAIALGLCVYSPGAVQGQVLDADELERQLALFASLSIEERKGIAGLDPERADVILAGATLLRTVLEYFDAESLVISDRGLRHGVMWDRFLQGSGPP